MPAASILARRRRLATASLLAATVTSALATHAPVPDERALLGDVPSVFAASKYDQPLADAPADVTVVTRAEIQRYGWRTLADVLRGVRGFLVTDDRNYSYAGMRGFARTGDYNARILVLVDGHRTNDTTYDQALLGTEGPVDLDLVERIEIVRGASSSLYGSNAFLGVIDLITRRGRDVAGVEVAGLGGTRETYGGRLTTGRRITSGTEYLASITLGRTAGERDFPIPGLAGGDRVAHDSDADRWVQAFGRLRIDDFTVTGVVSERKKEIPTAPFNSIVDAPGNETTDTRWWVEGKYDGAVGHGNLRVRFAVDDYRYQGDLLYGVEPRVVNQDRSHARWWSGEAAYTQALRDDLTLIVGAEVQSDIRNRQENGDRTLDGNADLEYTRLFLDTNTTRYWALFAQAQWQFAPRSSATLGVRHDQYSTFGGVTDPRLAITVRPTDTLTVKALYGQAFRAPNDYELYYNDGGTSIQASPNLVPERIRTSEILVEWQPAPQWRTVGAFYFNRITDLITTLADPATGLLTNVNAQSQIGRGVEAEIEGRTPFGLDVFAAVTTQLGEVAVAIPRTQLKARLAQSFLADRASVALETVYQTSRRTLFDTTIPAQASTNLVGTLAHVAGGLRLTAAVTNLFDVTLADVSRPEHAMDRIAQPGRGFWLKVEYTFR
ncbi:MAG: TonB-dependent receptor [Burkholderiales bacterium]|nr:TonB-dependent receptor [Burkholderiales bacterium]